MGSKIFGDKNTTEIGETKFALDELTSEHIAMYVTLKSFHFLAEEHGQPLVAAKDWYDTQRQMIQCVENTTSSFLLETSRFAYFSDLLIPSESVSVGGIITKTYDGSDLVLALNSYDDITPYSPSCLD